jgi:hypothetical protein
LFIISVIAYGTITAIITKAILCLILAPILMYAIGRNNIS